MVKFKKIFKKTLYSFLQTFPILIGVLLLVSYFLIIIPSSFYVKLFTGNKFTDSLYGALIGSVSGGNPITSYIIAGELTAQGVSLLAVISFILTWVTVGIIQLPAESLLLGKRFAITRNIVSFISAVCIAVLMVVTLSMV